MRRWLMVLGLWTLGMGSLVQATDLDCPNPNRFGFGKVVMVDKVVTCKRLEWREERIPREVQKVECRLEVRPVKRVFMVPRVFDEVRPVVDIVRTPKVEIRDVCRCRNVPVIMFDHATGCCFLSTRKEYYNEKVRCREIDTQVVTREVPVKVTRIVPEERIVNEKVMVKVCRPEIVTEVRRVPVFVPYQTTVRVPVCLPSDVPVAPPAGYPGTPGAPY
jgi:hypothetical protein